MAIAFNAAVDGGNNGGTTSSLSFSKTCAVSSTGLLIVAIVGDVVAGADDITGVTYNGVAMTLLAKLTTTGQRNQYFYYLLGPASGANTVAISAGSTHFLLAGAADYTGVKQTSQPDASTTQVSASAASTLTTSVTTVADNSWPVLIEQGFNTDGLGGGDPPGASTGDTRRSTDAVFGTWGIFDSNAAVTPAGSYSMTTTRTAAASKISHIIGSFAPDTGAGGGALSGSSAATSGATGTLTGTGALSGTSAATSGATGTLANGAAGSLSGTSSATSGATATLTAIGALIGSSAIVSNATGTLVDAIGHLSGAVSATTGATGTLRDGNPNNIWQAVSPASGTWTSTSGASGTWTPV